MCVTTIIDEMCSIKWDIVPKEGVDQEKVQGEIDQVKAFFENPNTNKESFEEIRRKYLRDILEIDAGVVNKIFNKKGEMVEIVARDGSTFTKNPDIYGMFTDRDDLILEAGIGTSKNNVEMGLISPADARERAAYFQYGWITGAKPVPFGKREILWFERNPRTDSIYGRSPVQILEDTIQTLIYSIEHNLEYFNDNSIPKGIIGLEGSNSEEITAFKEQWEQQQIKKDNAGNWKHLFHKLPIVGTMPKFERLQFSNAELELLEGQKWWAKLVWACFGVTSVELGYTEDSKGLANQIVQSNVFKKRSINPLLRLEEYKINHEIISEFGFDDILFKFQQFDVEEETKKAQLYKLQLDAGYKSINEIRVDEGLDEVEWGDKQSQNDFYGDYLSEIENPLGSEKEDLEKESKLQSRTDKKSFELKYKYIKRTGSPGNYSYWYRSPTGRLVRGDKPRKTTAIQRESPGKEKLNKLVNEADSFEGFLESFTDSDRFGVHDLDFISKEIPFKEIKPTQTGNDYMNDTSRGYARGEIVVDRFGKNERVINVGKLTDPSQLPAIIIDKNKNVIDGNHRLAAAEIVGLKKVKVVTEQDLKIFYEKNKKEKKSIEGKPGMGHSDKWWDMYNELIKQGHSKESAAKITNSKIDSKAIEMKKVVKRGNKWCVIHCHGKDAGKVIKCFSTKEAAENMHQAIMANKSQEKDIENLDIIEKSVDNPLILGENEVVGESKLKQSIVYLMKQNEKKIKELIEKEMGQNNLIKIKSVDDIAKRIKDLISFQGLKTISDLAIKNTFMKGWDSAEKQLNRNFMINRDAINYIQDYTFNNIKGMTEEIVNDLRQELERGIMNGEGITKIKARVGKVFDVGENRAEMIARTETSRSENQGKLQGFKASGEKLMKKWVAAMDNRTSELCKRLNGQVVGINENFKDKQTDGEWACPPAHVDCRSTLVFFSEKDEKKE